LKINIEDQINTLPLIELNNEHLNFNQIQNTNQEFSPINFNTAFLQTPTPSDMTKTPTDWNLNN